MKPDLNPKKSSHFGGSALTHGFEFLIAGRNQPDLSLILNPGVSFYAQNAVVKDSAGDIKDTLALGYGKKRGLASALVAAVNRSIGGEKIILTRLSNRGTSPLTVRVSAPSEGDLIAINLDELNGELVCMRGHFFAAPLGVRAGWTLNWNIPSMVFGGLPFLFQKISAPSGALKELGIGQQNEQGRPTSRNWVFLHAPGDVTVRDLHPDREPIRIRKGSLLAMASHTQKGATLTKQGFVSNLLNLMRDDGETFLSPTFSSDTEEMCEIKGPCRIWTTNTLEQ